MDHSRRNAVRIAILAVVVLALVGGLAAFRHVETLDDDGAAVIEEHRDRTQREHRVSVDGDTVTVRDRGGEVVFETTTSDWRENREEYQDRFDLGEASAEVSSES